ncbi:MAG: SCO family protein [Paracoccaceae bacterium]
MRNPMLAVAAALVLAIGAGGAYLALVPSKPYLSSAMLNVQGAAIGGPFELTAHTGERMTDKDVIDRPALIYFGYTFCPDICPIDVQIMADAVEILNQKGIDVRPVFVTVDPERDTPQELAYYAEAMHPKMLALTGTKDEIRAAADAYKVFYQRVEMPGSAAGYLMNHTGFTYLMTPEQGITAAFRRDFPPAQIAADIESVLSEM